MRERSDSTLAGRGAPAGKGAWVSIFVGDEHPVLRLKQALDWAAITAVMVTHWRAAGKNVDGRARAAVAGALVCALIGLNVAQDVSRAPNGGVHQRERGGAAVSGAAGRRAGARSAITRRSRGPKRRWGPRARRPSTPWFSRPPSSCSSRTARRCRRTRRCRSRPSGIRTSRGS